MNNLTSSLKSMAVEGKISLDKATKLAETIDKERNETIQLLKLLEKNVGMVLGEEINTHIAHMQGQKFNAVAYHYEKPVGEQ